MMFSPASPFLPPILFRSIFANKISSEASVLEKRWPAVNATTPGTLVPDHGPDLEPLPPVASLLATCEAARTQRSLAAKAETMSIPGLEGSAYLAAMRPPRPLHEAPKPRIHQQPIRIQAPTKLEGSRSRSRARDPAVQRARRARHRPAHERASRPSEADGCPPSLPAPETGGWTVWEPKSLDTKASVPLHQAGRPVPNARSRTCPDP